ncbi:MAG: T9SS type A sorting domain-containing protein [Paludibacter sp.]
MKKILFFAIITFSMNVIAQVNRPVFNQLQQPVIKHKVDWNVKLTNGRMKVQVQPSSRSLVPVQIIDSAYQYGWNSISNNWSTTPEYKNFMTYNAKNKISRNLFTYFNVDTWYKNTQTLYTYDANNNLTNTLNQYPNGDVWVNTNQIIQTYDAQNNEISNLSQNWNGTEWTNSFQQIKTYDNNKNITSESYQLWSKGAIFQGSKSFYTYDIKNNMTSYLYQNWDTISVAWVNSSKTTDTFDGNNLITHEIGQEWKSGVWVDAYQVINISWSANAKYPIAYTYQKWNGTAFVDDSQNTSTVDINGNQTSSIVKKWLAGAWVNSERNIYTYDVNNNQTSDSFQTWDGSAWVNSTRQLTTYDARNNQTSYSTQTWNKSAWLNSNISSTKTFDSDNFIVNQTYKNWNPDGITVSYADSTHNYYHTILLSGLKNTQTANNNISVYPNPSNGKFIISSPENSINAIEIFNLLGDKVYSNTNQPAKSEIDLSTAAKGVYLLKFNNGVKSNNTKIVIQ